MNRIQHHLGAIYLPITNAAAVCNLCKFPNVLKSNKCRICSGNLTVVKQTYCKNCTSLVFEPFHSLHMCSKNNTNVFQGRNKNEQLISRL